MIETTLPGTMEPTVYSAMGFLSLLPLGLGAPPLLPGGPFLMEVFFSAVFSSFDNCIHSREWEGGREEGGREGVMGMEWG
jgi:uncharacterized membrane protein YbaN (DUF454 family)